MTPFAKSNVPFPWRRLAAVVCLASLLAACAQNGAPPPNCPKVVTLQDASRLVKFTGAGRDLTDVIFEAELRGVGLSCRYDDGALALLLNVELAAARGPADRERLARLGYFVAIATRDRRIIAREEFDVALPFEGNRTRVRLIEEITPRIPATPGLNGADYLIYVGFRLSPDELRYNRENL